MEKFRHNLSYSNFTEKTGNEYLNSQRKRNLDLLGAVALSSIAVPVVSGFSILSALDTKDNPFFKQSRVGKNGESFDVRKLRTLSRESVDFDPTRRGSKDSRASCIGKLMRKTGIDELPQLASVISGEMSLVGPRPIIENDLNYIEEADGSLFDDWYEVYSASRPGITGTSQIYRKNAEHNLDSWRESMKLDIQYFETASLKEDIRIIGITPFKLFKHSSN
ncbi:MAG: sugar transferase [bacterium]